MNWKYQAGVWGTAIAGLLVWNYLSNRKEVTQIKITIKDDSEVPSTKK